MGTANSVNDLEKALLAQTEEIIISRRQPKPGRGAGARLALPRKILLNGYCGVGNVGADIRMGEIIRQVCHLFSPDQVRFDYTCPQSLNYGAYARIKKAGVNSDLGSLLSDYDGVMVCEGSLFKSHFSNTMALSFMGVLGIAAAENKPGIAYGVEAGKMDCEIARFAKMYCQDSLILSRSVVSHRLLTEELGLSAELGTDTAWTFKPASSERGFDLLKAAGWDGISKLVCVSPVNPFWWPVQPDLEKAAVLQASGAFKHIHRNSIFFHYDSEEARTRYHLYIAAIAEALTVYRRQTDAFLVLVGMEQQDRMHCRDLQSRLDMAAPIFMSGDYSHEDIVSVLRHAFIGISSRYHALVTAMPGCVPSIGITMDERIRNLMSELGAEECLLEAGDPDLCDALVAALRHVDKNHASYAAALPVFVGTQLRRMGRMGQLLCREFAFRFPELEPTPRKKVEDYLPPLNEELLTFLDMSAE